jgi:putative transposase
MAKHYDELAVALKKHLPGAFLEALGRTTGFIQRLRAVSAPDFVWAVVLSRFSSGMPGFDQARRLFNQMSGSAVHPRPFQMRFKTEKVVALFEQVFEASVARWKEPRKIASPLAKHFPDIVAIDSTVVQTNDKLRPHFKGQRWAKSQAKVGLAISVFGLVPLIARVVCRCVHDSTLFPALTALKAGSLLLVDNAFVSYGLLRDAAERKLFFLCPMRCNAHAQIIDIYQAPKRVRDALRRSPAGVPLRSLLSKAGSIGKTWDLKVTVEPTAGDDRTPVEMRLVIVPFKKETYYYLTNLDPKWRPAAIVELYRLRWQIELVFKELKQHLALEAVPTKDPHAVKALLWASLIALAISRTISACLTPIHRLNGLAADHCPALVSRALGALFGLLGPMLFSARRAAPRGILTYLSSSTMRTTVTRQDSFQRLAALLPAAA